VYTSTNAGTNAHTHTSICYTKQNNCNADGTMGTFQGPKKVSVTTFFNTARHVMVKMLQLAQFLNTPVPYSKGINAPLRQLKTPKYNY